MPLSLSKAGADFPQDQQGSIFFSLFSAVWALNLLLYYIRFPVDEAIFILLFLPVTATFIIPSSPWPLLAFALGHLIIFVCTSPNDSNYLTVTAFLNCSLLFCAFFSWLARAREPFSLAAVLTRFRPLLVIIISLTYLLSVFNMLNTSFLDPDTSYGVRLLTSMREDDYPALLAWVPNMTPRGPVGDFIAIWGTLAIESIIPVCILIPRLRFAGIVLDFVFHFIMGYRTYPPSTNFPCLLSGSMMLLFPTHASQFLSECFSWILRIRPVAWIRGHRCMTFLLLSVILAPFVFDFTWLPKNFHAFRDFCRAFFWNAYVAGYAIALVLYALSIFRRRLALANNFNSFAMHPRALWLLPICFFLQCLAPHLGLKSRASAEVYSGLLTFEGKTNHLFIPSTVQIFPYLKDTLTIVGPSSSAYITKLGEERAVMPYLHFIRLARRHKKHSATFEYRGETHHVEHLRDLPDVQVPPFNALELRFLPMHHVPESEMDSLRKSASEN